MNRDATSPAVLSMVGHLVYFSVRQLLLLAEIGAKVALLEVCCEYYVLL